MEQRTFNLCVLYILCTNSRNDYDVKTTVKHIFMQTIAFPDQPGDMMPDNTVPHFFAN